MHTTSKKHYNDTGRVPALVCLHFSSAQLVSLECYLVLWAIAVSISFAVILLDVIFALQDVPPW
jgi:hypothetical protein